MKKRRNRRRPAYRSENAPEPIAGHFTSISGSDFEPEYSDFGDAPCGCAAHIAFAFAGFAARARRGECRSESFDWFISELDSVSDSDFEPEFSDDGSHFVWRCVHGYWQVSGIGFGS